MVLVAPKVRRESLNPAILESWNLVLSSRLQAHSMRLDRPFGNGCQVFGMGVEGREEGLLMRGGKGVLKAASPVWRQGRQLC